VLACTLHGEPVGGQLGLEALAACTHEPPLLPCADACAGPSAASTAAVEPRGLWPDLEVRAAGLLLLLLP
jgi:hypothetical protein